MRKPEYNLNDAQIFGYENFPLQVHGSLQTIDSLQIAGNFLPDIYRSIDDSLN